MNIRLAFIGKAGAGKSTAAGIITEKYGFECVGFADLIKDAARTFGWNGQKTAAGRRLLQAIGDAVRAYDPAIFHKILCDRISRNPWPIVVDDVRLDAEVDFLHQHGFYVLLFQGHESSQTGDAASHITEQISHGCKHDEVLSNDGSIAGLESKLDEIIGRLAEKLRNGDGINV